MDAEVDVWLRVLVYSEGWVVVGITVVEGPSTQQAASQH